MSLVTPAESWCFGVAHSVCLMLVHRHSVGAHEWDSDIRGLRGLRGPKAHCGPTSPQIACGPRPPDILSLLFDSFAELHTLPFISLCPSLPRHSTSSEGSLGLT